MSPATIHLRLFNYIGDGGGGDKNHIARKQPRDVIAVGRCYFRYTREALDVNPSAYAPEVYVTERCISLLVYARVCVDA